MTNINSIHSNGEIIYTFGNCSRKPGPSKPVEELVIALFSVCISDNISRRKCY
jgi:hypothetical protein